MRRTLAITLACASLLASGRPAAAQPPVINFAQPAAIVPGVATDVTFFGGNLAGVTGFWNELGASAELTPGVENNGAAADRVTYRLLVPADAAVGIGGYRVATGQGIANVRLLMIDDLPTALDNSANKSLEAAQPITLPTAIDGACEAESFDFYKFTGVAGQRLSVEVVARRLGSPLDPVIRLLDANGRELAYSDDEPALGADSRFALQLPADGDYVLEIRDIRYQGGGNHRYRIRLGDFPLVTVPYPPTAQLGTVPQLAIGHAANDLTGAARLLVELPVPADPALRQLRVGVRYPHGTGTAATRLAVSPREESIEFEPNDTPETASPARLGGGWSGRFEKAKDRDFFQFEAPAGARFRFVGQTRSLGSPTDLFLRLYKADGGLLAEADDAETDEGTLDHTFAEAGVYRLMAEDLHRRGGPEHVYRIQVEPYQPGFTLALESDKFDAPQGGVFVAKVTAGRRDYNGPITLSVEGTPEPLRVAGEVIPEGKNETVLNVTLPAGLAAGSWHPLKIVGRAKIGEQEFAATASTAGALRGQFNGLPYPPDSLDGAVGLGVGPVFAEFFKLNVDGGSIAFPQLVATATFTVKAERLNGFVDPIALAVEGLPAGFTAEIKPIEKDKTDAAIVLKGPAAAAAAVHRLRVVGNGTHQNQPKQVVVGDVALRVIPPLEITLAPAGALPAGGTQKVKVTARFFNDEKPAVTLAWSELPSGVTGPESITIPAGQTEVEIELAAAGNAALGAGMRASATATTTVAGREVTATATTPLEVKMP
ncbi:MAG: PPC domain-containing protein [Planctomycetaceae bacterium]|nr:PPC domain-containing protein [Planctomycetaceae bacterium]